MTQARTPFPFHQKSNRPPFILLHPWCLKSSPRLRLDSTAGCGTGLSSVSGEYESFVESIWTRNSFCLARSVSRALITLASGAQTIVHASRHYFSFVCKHIEQPQIQDPAPKYKQWSLALAQIQIRLQLPQCRSGSSRAQLEQQLLSVPLCRVLLAVKSYNSIILVLPIILGMLPSSALWVECHPATQHLLDL